MTGLREHWIVGTGPIEPDVAQYRRDRLASYLARRSDTDRVYWVHVRSSGRRPIEVTRHGETTWQVAVRDVLGLVRFGLRVPLVRALRPHLRANTERVLWFTHPSLPCLARDTGWDRIVYDCSDLWPAWRDLTKAGLRIDWKAGGRQRWLIRAEREIVEKATYVVASSSPIVEHLRHSYGRTVDGVVENGVDFERFADAGRTAAAGTPQLVYTGTLSAKLDWKLLDRLGSALPDADIVLAGAIRSDCERSLSSLTRRPNIRHIGVLAPEQVPGLVAGAKVGLIPYSDTQYNHAGSPLKLFEYLAAGVPVVGFGIAMGRRYHSPGVYFHAQDHDAFVGECSRLLARPDTPEDEAARRAVAADHDWALTLGHIVDLALGEGPHDVRPVSRRHPGRRQSGLRSKVGRGA